MQKMQTAEMGQTMKSVKYSLIVFLSVLSIVLFAAKPKKAPDFSDSESVVENVRIPLEKHPNGRVKALLIAKRAQVPSSGAIHASDVFVELYSETGAFDGLLKTEGLTMNPATREAYDPRSAHFEYKGVTISGVGIAWNDEKQTIRLESNVVMQITLGEGSLIKETGK